MGVLVKLTTRHTHSGKTYEAGAEIVVSRAEAEWLLANRIIEKIPAKKKQDKE